MPVQRQEDLPVGELLSQLVRGVHGEGRLADPGHPADRVNVHHASSARELHQLALPAGKGDDVPGQRPGGAGDSSTRHPPPSHRLEPLPFRPG